MYCFYKFQLKKLKVNSLYTQAWVTKLLPLITMEYENLFFYGGGRSSADSDDEGVYKEFGPNFLISKTLKDKRNFAMPFFIRNKLKSISYCKSDYINNDNSHRIDSLIESLKNKTIDYESILIIGSYEEISSNYENRIEKVLNKNYLKLSESNNIIYRPHPRRSLNKKEKEVLINLGAELIKPLISLESDLSMDRIKGTKIPHIIMIQRSSAEIVLNRILPKEVKLITEEI